MTQRSSNKIKSITWIVFVILSTVVVIAVFFNQNNIKKIIDYGIYSNIYHYLECDKLPSYQPAKTLFQEKQASMLDLVKQLEKVEDSDQSNQSSINYMINENSVEGGFIAITLNQTCDKKAEINVTVTSNKFNDPIINFLDKELPEVPYNIINN